MKTVRKRQKKAGPFEIVESKGGTCRVKVYRTRTAADYESFQVADYSSGKRKLRTFTDIDKARAEAKFIADKLAAGEKEVLNLTPADRASYQRATELLKGTGMLLETAVASYVAATKELGSNDLMSAVRFYLENEARKIVRKRVGDVIDELIASKRARKKSDRYLKDLEYRLGKFRKAFQCDIGAVRGSDLQNFMDGLKLSNGSYRNFRVVLGTLFLFAKRRRYLPQTWQEFDLLEKVDATDGEVLVYKPDELVRLLDAAASVAPNFVPCLAIGAFAGLRSSEIERLEWQDVKFDEGVLIVRGKKRNTPSRRVVPIQPNLARWFSAYSKKASGRVWKGEHDAFYDAQQAVAAATGAEGVEALEWRQNALRHSFLSYRLATVKNDAIVAAEGGNSATVVHRHYKALVSEAEGKAWFEIVPKS